MFDDLFPETDALLNRYAAIPLAERLDVHPTFHGRGVTVAVIDADFRSHPDLEGRVSAFIDVTGECRQLDEGEVGPTHWHGTQTSVVAAGDGSLSGGVYRGLASGSQLVLLKVAEEGRVEAGNILKALEWLKVHGPGLGVRLASISLGCEPEPEETEALDQAALELAKHGILVVVAAGNTGFGPGLGVPANSPFVLTVGGTNDENTVDPPRRAYHSNFGTARDAMVVKPEVVAPAAWVAAPLLLGTEVHERALLISKVSRAPDYRLSLIAREVLTRLGRQEELPELLQSDLRARINELIRRHKIVADHYQHVDGTSFAAPIVTSVAAQMLEANPRLTPLAIRAILMCTADRLEGVPSLRQGFGAVHPRRAVEEAIKWRQEGKVGTVHPPRALPNGRLLFTFLDEGVDQVELFGDFNQWKGQPLKRDGDRWVIEIDPLPAGCYPYKFRLDGGHWREDPLNLFRSPDPFGGNNSLVVIQA